MTDAIGSAMTTRADAGSERSPGLEALAQRDTFLKLLVAQVQNQDPLNPQEPIQFVSQLAQFSQLETLLGMRTTLEGIEQSLISRAAAPEGSGEIEGPGAAGEGEDDV